MGYFTLTPSSNLSSVDIGEIFTHENGHTYKLIARDAVKCVVKSWTWWDDLRTDFMEFLRGGKPNGTAH